MVINSTVTTDLLSSLIAHHKTLLALNDGDDELSKLNAKYHADHITALRELLQLRQSRRWQPIETAPGSHKMFLVHAPTSQRGPVDYAFKEFNTGKIMVQAALGWEPIENFGGTATHWQPLPPPPLGEPQHE